MDVFGNQPPVQLTGYHSTHPSISPDSPKIAYHFIDYGSKNPHWKLGIVNSENRNLLNKLEFPIPISERQTTWRPRTDSLTLIFQNGENVGIILLSATDGKFQIIDNLAVNKISSVGWSTDGSRFAFSQIHETNDAVEINGF